MMKENLCCTDVSKDVSISMDSCVPLLISLNFDDEALIHQIPQNFPREIFVPYGTWP